MLLLLSFTDLGNSNRVTVVRCFLASVRYERLLVDVC